MSLFNIIILILTALLIRLAFPGKLRRWVLLVSSILAIFWLQPALPIRNMDFWFPTATIGLIFLTWGLMADKEQWQDQDNWLAWALAIGTILLIALTRFISLEGILTSARPPQFHLVVIVLLVFASSAYLLTRITKPKENLILLGVVILLVFFFFLKTPILALYSSMGLRQIMSQNPALANSTDIGWLGFSYVAFRLIHTLIDRINGRLQSINFSEILVYTIFFPAFIAGPLDRLDRFRNDLYNPKPLDGVELCRSGERLTAGLFKKFILADSLAFIAISGTNASQTQASGWLWLMLAAYAFQIFFDFSGYTDIAIGSGRILGFSLPENFNQPYRKPNLTLFWNNWHMTLTQWFRSYFFFPFTRYLRSDGKLPAALIIFITQMSTMVVIGLWHGITRNFLIWGIWHGLGLFIHNRWSAFAKPQVTALTKDNPLLAGSFNAVGVILTFLFVSLGWVWFALPSTALALSTFAKLFGMGV